MRVIVLDFESYFDKSYSLKSPNYSTESYVRTQELHADGKPLFQAHMLGYWEPAHMAQGPVTAAPAMLESNDDLRATIASSAVIAHHAAFDGLILEHHYGLKPAFWFDTLSMARLVLPKLKSHSLDNLAAHFGFGAKSVPYSDFRGVRELDPALYARLAVGCKQDVALTWSLFSKLLPLVPPDELKIIDSTIRMFTEPCLRLDRPRMEKFLLAERVRKAKAMLQAGEVILGSTPYPTVDGLREYLEAVEIQLQSADKFRLALESLGYPCPMKWSEKAKGFTPCPAGCDQGYIVDPDIIYSAEEWDLDPPVTLRCPQCGGTGTQPAKGGWIPALAKNDDGMKELLEHDDSRVQALAAARLGVKSTIDETRAERLLSADGRGPLPVYLSYAAAKTLRFGGGDKTNWQNFRRGGEIRHSVRAPEGHKLVIGDLSQIEYRLILWVTGQLDKLDKLAAGFDLYCEFASQFYGEEITKEDKPRRGVGKQGILMGGYGAGRGTMISTAAGGGYGPPVFLSDAEGQRMVDLYRQGHPHVVAFWRWCDQALRVLASGGETSYRDGLLRISNHKIHLPNSTSINYEGLRWATNTEIYPEQQDDGQGLAWWQPTRKGYSRIWGSKVTADVIQALACVVIKDVWVRMLARHVRPALQVHDELVYCVRSEDADRVAHGLKKEMTTPPAWCAGIPLAAEIEVSENYSK